MSGWRARPTRSKLPRSVSAKSSRSRRSAIANLFTASQACLVNNLNDGMSWSIFPLFFASFGFGVERIGILKAIYPATWGHPADCHRP